MPAQPLTTHQHQCPRPSTYTTLFRSLFQVHVHAYVLMANHYHLLLELPEGNLSGGLQWLKIRNEQVLNPVNLAARHRSPARKKIKAIDQEREEMEARQ